MNWQKFDHLVEKSLSGSALDDAALNLILDSDPHNLLGILQAAYQIRHQFYQNKIFIHILNNAQNGFCSEDCHYCAQSASSKAEIEEYPLKSDEEILQEAENAYKKGAFRYCMVFSGKQPSMDRILHLAELVKTIKAKYPIQVCVSPGVIDEEMAKILKDAGLDRINHNINTSEQHYSKICTSHSFQDRINTLNAAQRQGLQICSGVIIGMGESREDIIWMAKQLHARKADSIPINFFIPIPGIQLDIEPKLDPETCLRVLCLFRFLNPEADIRVAAGRELYLRDFENLAYFPANSLFLDGYLNVKGEQRLKTLQMLKDAKFQIESEIPLEELINNEKKLQAQNQTIELKSSDDLRSSSNV